MGLYRELIEFELWDVDPETVAKLIGHHGITRGGPYGPVSRATITLRGYYKKFVDLPGADRD
jgi:hypothetical protein